MRAPTELPETYITSDGPVMYTRRRVHGQLRIRCTHAERVICVECGEPFWRWRGGEVTECAQCQYSAKWRTDDE